MNKEMIDRAFKKWFEGKYAEAVQWRDWQSCENLIAASTWMQDGFKAAFELLYPIILKQRECIEFYSKATDNPKKYMRQGYEVYNLKKAIFVDGGELARKTLLETDKMMNEIKGDSL